MLFFCFLGCAFCLIGISSVATDNVVTWKYDARSCRFAEREIKRRVVTVCEVESASAENKTRMRKEERAGMRA